MHKGELYYTSIHPFDVSEDDAATIARDNSRRSTVDLMLEFKAGIL
jgi:hypothetical protein